MGKTLQVRGTVQVVDLRTLNAEINELLKLDLDEVEERAVKEFDLDPSAVDQKVDFVHEGMPLTSFLLIQASQPFILKFNSSLNPGIATTFLMHFGNVASLFLTAGATGAHIRIIALAGE